MISNRIQLGTLLRRPVQQPSTLDQIRLHIDANFYPTPPEATRALLSVEHFDDAIWEPACGQGAISKVLVHAGYRVISTDLNAWGYGASGINFLQEQRPRAKHIVTNPPYGSGLADAFVLKALDFTRRTAGKTAMLLNLASLAHRQRTAQWRAVPPARIHVIDSVICWPEPDRAPPKHFLAHRYFWAVWEPGHTGPSALWWLSAADFCDNSEFFCRNKESSSKASQLREAQPLPGQPL